MIQEDMAFDLLLPNASAFNSLAFCMVSFLLEGPDRGAGRMFLWHLMKYHEKCHRTILKAGCKLHALGYTTTRQPSGHKAFL
jgi:hypothetical protein